MSEHHRFSIQLDSKGERVFGIHCPASVTQEELNRIIVWISKQLLIIPAVVDIEQDQAEVNLAHKTAQ